MEIKIILVTISAVLLAGCSKTGQLLSTKANPSDTALLQRQVTVEELKSIGDLHLAVEAGDLNAVRQCLETGTDINCVRGKASFRVLHRAADAGNKSMVRLLIQKQASVNPRAMSGWTPLDLALKKGHLEVVQLLREYGGKMSKELIAEGK